MALVAPTPSLLHLYMLEYSKIWSSATFSSPSRISLRDFIQTQCFKHYLFNKILILYTHICTYIYIDFLYAYLYTHTHTQISSPELSYDKFKTRKITSAPPWSSPVWRISVTHTIIYPIFQTKILGITVGDFFPSDLSFPINKSYQLYPHFIPFTSLSLHLPLIQGTINVY